MKVSGDMSGSVADHEEKQQGNAQHKEERVGLQVAGLHEAQGAAHDFDRAVRATDHEARDDPAVEKVGDLREHFLRGADEAGVNFIEVKPVAHHACEHAQTIGQRIVRSVLVKLAREREAERHRGESCHRSERRVVDRLENLVEHAELRRRVGAAVARRPRRRVESNRPVVNGARARQFCDSAKIVSAMISTARIRNVIFQPLFG